MSAPSPMSAPQVMAPPPDDELRFRRVHLGFSIVQIVAGLICIITDIVGYAILRGYVNLAVGFWTGIIFLLAGIFGVVGGVKSNRSCIMACMVLSIIGAVFAFCGACAATYLRIFAPLFGSSEGDMTKTVVLITVCGLMFIITIVHSAFMCTSTRTCVAPTPQRSQVGATYQPQNAGKMQIVVMQPMVAEPGFLGPHQPQPPPEYKQ